MAMISKHDSTSAGGNSYGNPNESFGPIGDPAAKKRGGRKPGSKNKPKVEACQAPHVDIQFSAQAIGMANLRAAASDSIEILLAAAAIQVSAMDSESRLAEKIKELQRAMLSAVELLRAAL